MRRFLIAKRGLQCVGLRVRRQSQMLLYQLPDFLDECVQACAFFVDYRRAAHQRHERSVGILNTHSGGAFATFYHNLDLPILLFLRLENAAERSDTVDLLGAGFVNSGVVLSGEKDGAVTGQRLFECSNRPGATDFEGDFGKGEYYDVA